MTDLPIPHSLILCLLITMVACHSRITESADRPSLDLVAKRLYSDDYRVVENESKDFALITKPVQIRTNDAFPTLSFSVYDVVNDSVVYQSTIARGKVAWHDDRQVIFESVPGRAENLPVRRIYHVETRKLGTLDE